MTRFHFMCELQRSNDEILDGTFGNQNERGRYLDAFHHLSDRIEEDELLHRWSKKFFVFFKVSPSNLVLKRIFK